MSESTKPTKRITLYSEYSESGFQGAVEKRDECELEVTGTNRAGLVILTVEDRRTSFPSNDDLGSSVDRYSITAGDLAALIVKHGVKIAQ